MWEIERAAERLEEGWTWMDGALGQGGKQAKQQSRGEDEQQREQQPHITSISVQLMFTPSSLTTIPLLWTRPMDIPTGPPRTSPRNRHKCLPQIHPYLVRHMSGARRLMGSFLLRACIDIFLFQKNHV